jgi:hypothetical protein
MYTINWGRISQQAREERLVSLLVPYGMAYIFLANLVLDLEFCDPRLDSMGLRFVPVLFPSPETRTSLIPYGLS